MAKRQLTDVDKVPIALPARLNGPRGAIDVQRSLSRPELDALTEHLVDRLAEPYMAALSDAGIQPAQVDDVLLVGGITRCAAVRQRIATLFRRPCQLCGDPDEAVAIGAAMEAAILAGEVDDTVLVDVLAHTISVHTRAAPSAHGITLQQYA